MGGEDVPLIACTTGSTLTAPSSALSESSMATSPSPSFGGGADDCLDDFDGGTTTVISSSLSLMDFLVLGFLSFMSLPPR